MRVRPCHGFRLGVEVEFHAAARLLNTTLQCQGWEFGYDGDGPVQGGLEARFVGYSDDPDDIATRCHALSRYLRTLPVFVSTKTWTNYSARGVHVHVSHPVRRITTLIAQHAKQGHVWRAKTWRSRWQYARSRSPDRDHYAAINVRDNNHIELRAFNGTIATRGLIHACNEALRIADTLFTPDEVCPRAWTTARLAGRA